MAHFSETCEDAAVHLITHTHTTPATVHEAQCTEVIHQGLLKKGLLPREHLVDSAYKHGQGMRYASTEINGSCFEPKIGTGDVVKRSKVARLKAVRFGASARSKIQ
jgi:hypothetical protein